ncbi:phosphoglucomutase-2 [Phakopsora pachyrhizi]|uniref:Phosphoglucomutase-2 n=1 Tax=Phakopsora pachyrhizi TaxID=170000 RepID=A0AAV0BJ81_PHAPC|nr:phosphoglucomutase-2 [Phakopsora pachyrhizi]
MAEVRNPKTRKEIEDLSVKDERAELSSRLQKRISFGTAGLRARMSAGFACMNDLIVIQTSQGLAKYLIHQNSEAAQKGVVVGHDHRHNSKRFASLACVAFVRSGLKCYLLKGYVATPLVPFGVKHLGAVAGVMITASHNPAADNGYKLYYSNAVQIISPHDVEIAASIEKNLEVEEEAWDLDLIERSRGGLCIDLTDEIKEKYFECILEVNKRPPEVNFQSPVKFIYTPIHGVGFDFVARAFEQAGFNKGSLNVVTEQKDPDPDFSTVKFPNPEEKGALDLAMGLGESIYRANPDKVVIILANDPDADRFCAAEWNGKSWDVFTGDQIGAILGVWIFRKYQKSGKDVGKILTCFLVVAVSLSHTLFLAKLAMLASTASSKLLAEVARREGFKFKETLTGFKYLGNSALELEKNGYNVPFAYEEALGYMCGTSIRDKDGISALVSWAELCSEIAESGDMVSEYLGEIYRTKNPSKLERRFRKLRFVDTHFDFTGADRNTLLTTIKYPSTLGSYPITSIRDLTIGYDTEYPPSFIPELPTSTSTQMITFKIDGKQAELVLTLRTSGTEAWKLKYYVEGRASDPNIAKKIVDGVVDALKNDWGLARL